LDINPSQTPHFFEAMRTGNADIVVGSKRHPDSKVQYPWHRRIVSWVYFSLVRWFVGIRITDTQTGMKLFRREILKYSIERMLVKTYAFDLELLSIAARKGAKVAEAPVVIRFGDRFGALKISTVISMAMDSLAVFYRLKILGYYDKVESLKPLEAEKNVSVVIACPGWSNLLAECLAALDKQTYRNFEVIVLPDFDCPEKDGFKLSNLDVRIIPTGKVRPAEKRNLGIKESKGEIVAFIDDDAYPDIHWIEYAVKYFVSEKIGSVGGPGITPPGSGYMSYLGGRVYENILVSGNYRYRYKAGGVRRDVDDYPSCNLFVTKNVLDAIGGYRTDFWPGEDTLLCKSTVDAGFRIVYDPWVIVYHHRRALFAPHLRQLGRYAFHRGYFCKKYPSNSLRLSYFIPTFFVVYLLMWFLMSCISVVQCSVASYIINGYLLLLPFYVALVLITSFSLNPVTWIMTAFGVAVTHIVYGVKFLHGLIAKKAPCEFIGKDSAK
jgi:GT2 family glycosyltransferase